MKSGAEKVLSGGIKLTPPSKGHKPNGPHGRAAVHALGRTKTTGNFKKIEAAKGKGAAIDAYPNLLSGGLLIGINGLIDRIRGKSPEDAAKLAELVQKYQDDALAADQSALAAVNATMQAETKSEHWAQWMWRPTVGFTFCAVLVNNYIVIPYFPSAHTILVPGEVWNSILVILGAASALRGYQKVVATKSQ